MNDERATSICGEMERGFVRSLSFADRDVFGTRCVICMYVRYISRVFQGLSGPSRIVG